MAHLIEPREVAGLLAKHPNLIILDVRTPQEFASHHLPGGQLMPIQELGARCAELDSKNQLFLVHCEHGVRSRSACEFLTAQGYANIYDLRGGLAAWNPAADGALEAGLPGRDCRHTGLLPPRELAEWLPAHLNLPVQNGKALDLAAGNGRVSRYLLAEGFSVTAVDRETVGLSTLTSMARFKLIELDLEAAPALETTARLGKFDLIAVVNYLHRPLLAELPAMLNPGGLLFYSTFATDPRATAGPTNPDFLLRPGELLQAFKNLQPLEYRERFDGATCRASLLAKKDEV